MKTIILIYFCSITVVASQSLSQRVDSLNKIAWEQRETDPKDALRLSQEAIELSTPPSSSPPYAHGLGAAYSTMGFVKMMQGAPTSEILSAWQESIRYRRSIGDSVRIANVYNQMADFYVSKGDYIKALDYSQRACDILRDPEVPSSNPIAPEQRRRNLGNAYIALSKIYERQNLDTLALLWANKAKSALFQAKTPEDSLDAWLYAWEAYYYAGEGRDNKQYLDTAIQIYRTYLNIPLDNDWSMHHAFALSLLERGGPGDTAEATLVLKKALEVLPNADSLERLEGACYINLTQGQLLLKTNPSQAINYLRQAARFGPFNLDAMKRLELWEALGEAYKGIGNLGKAYDFQRRAYELNDSLQNVRIGKQLHELDVQRLETSKQAAEVEASKQRNRFKNLAFGTAACVLLWLLYSLNYRRKANKQLAEAFDDLRKEAQIFAEAVRKEERRFLGEKTHDHASALTMVSKVSQVLLESTEQSSPNYPLAQHIQQSLSEKATELRNQSEQLREGEAYQDGNFSSLGAFIEKMTNILSKVGRLRVERRVSVAEIPPSTEAMAGTIVQELLCNTLKHAKAKRVEIFVEQQESALWIHYQDDGVGFPEEKNGGNGLKDMKKRAEVTGGTFDVTNKPDGKGVKIEITLPITPKA